MSEKTYTTAEVVEMLTLISEAMEKGADLIGKMLGVLPAEMLASKSAAEWITVYAEENVKQIDALAETIRKG
jgi:hypothetical protein